MPSVFSWILLLVPKVFALQKRTFSNQFDKWILCFWGRIFREDIKISFEHFLKVIKKNLPLIWALNINFEIDHAKYDNILGPKALKLFISTEHNHVARALNCPNKCFMNNLCVFSPKTLRRLKKAFYINFSSPWVKNIHFPLEMVG